MSKKSSSSSVSEAPLRAVFINPGHEYETYPNDGSLTVDGKPDRTQNIHIDGQQAGGDNSSSSSSLSSISSWSSSSSSSLSSSSLSSSSLSSFSSSSSSTEHGDPCCETGWIEGVESANYSNWYLPGATTKTLPGCRWLLPDPPDTSGYPVIVANAEADGTSSVWTTSFTWTVAGTYPIYITYSDGSTATGSVYYNGGTDPTLINSLTCPDNSSSSESSETSGLPFVHPLVWSKRNNTSAGNSNGVQDGDGRSRKRKRTC